MNETADSRSNPITFGICAMIVATLALFISVAHLSLGPFEQQKPIEQTIGETAVKIKEAAKRAITGEAKPVQESRASTMDLDFVTTLAALGLAGLAMLLAIVGLAFKESRPPVYIGFSLGAGILLMVWLQWIALLICGVILLVAIINNLGDILPS